ncbi:MAG: hypothetical protein KJO38_12170 [Gammaproteobacteria bacterium]|nr:hypothetical protein [Gammaproteobacteria bacterium]
MKLINKTTLPALTLTTLVLTSAAASAEGFAPWNDRGPASSPDARQVEIEIRPYYGQGLPRFADSPDAVQARIDIGAWYAPARDLPPAARALVELAGE